MNIDRAQLHLVTPELEPLEIFGTKASAAVAELLDAARITLHPGVDARIPYSGHITTGSGPELVVDCVIALPILAGPELGGVPCDAYGFIPVDDAGLVDGLDSVYAIGDATDRPIKQGGLACQQADVAAAHIAARAGADVVVPPLQQVLHGRLLTGTRDRFLRREAADAQGSATDDPPLWAPAKVSGEYLSPYLAAKNVVHLPLRGRDPSPGIDVAVPLTREQKRVHADVLGLSPLGAVLRR
jgi:sulfide:quinone oxidoreductase